MRRLIKKNLDSRLRGNDIKLILSSFLCLIILTSCTKKEIIFDEPPIVLKSSVLLTEEPEKVWKALTDIFFEHYEFDLYLVSQGLGKISTRWVHFIDNGMSYKFQMNASVSVLKEGVMVVVYKQLMKLNSNHEWVALISDQREEKKILEQLQARFPSSIKTH